MGKPSDIQELVEEQNTDAREWAKAFCQTLKDNPGLVLDEGLMIGWFANPIMCMYDRLQNKEIAPLKAKLEVARAALQFYAGYDFIHRDTAWARGFRMCDKALTALKQIEEE